MEEQEKKKHHKWLKRLIFLFLTLFLISSSFLLYSRFAGTKGLFMKEYRIVDSNLSDNFYGLKIVHISDLHYGTTFLKEDLETLTTKVNRAKPDLVVFTGDLIDASAKLETGDLEALTKSFSDMNGTIGKYAVSGDQDEDRASLILSNSGFSMLTDSYELIYQKNNVPLLLSGVSSNRNAGSSIATKVASTITYLSSLGENSIKPSYKILLLHEPDFIDEIDPSYFQLILAGHSNGGLIRIPYLGGLFLPKGAKKYSDDFYQLGNTKLFVSSGIGTTNMKFRFHNRPSFNLYRLVNK